MAIGKFGASSFASASNLGYDKGAARESERQEKARLDALPSYGGVKWDSKIYGAAPQGNDPRGQQALDAQKQVQKEFERNESRLRDEALRAADQDSAQNTDASLRAIRRRANARGLLFSGTREGLEGDATNQGYMDLIQSRLAANDKVTGVKDAISQAPLDMKYQLANASLSGQGGAVNTNLQVQDLIERIRMNRENNMNQLIGSLGMAAGTYAGQSRNKGDKLSLDTSKATRLPASTMNWGGLA